MRYLLDKNIVRYAITGLLYGRRRLLSSLEAGALSFMRAAETEDHSLYISHVSFEVLKRLKQYAEVNVILTEVDVLFPTRYYNRWSRRVRETSGLSREDAAIIALASFGTNSAGSILGTHAVVTYDQPMVNGYRQNLPLLQRRLRAMSNQLPVPFYFAKLPEILTPDQFLQR